MFFVLTGNTPWTQYAETPEKSPFQPVDLSLISKRADISIRVHSQSMLVSLLVLGVLLYKTNYDLVSRLNLVTFSVISYHSLEVNQDCFNVC